MKSLCKKSLFVTALVAVSCFFYGCSDEEANNVSPQVTDFTVRVNNGYLEFKDQAAFDQVKASLEDRDDEALAAWESQFNGFTSMRSVDEKSIDAQDAWFEELRNMTESERTLLQQSDDDFWYSDYIKKHASSFILQDSGMYELNVTAAGTEILSFLNQDGVYRIGNDIYMLKNNSTKIIHDGDDSKIQMLAEIDESDDNLQISVYKDIITPLRGEEVNGRQAVDIMGYQGANGCSSVDGDQKVIGVAYILLTPIPTTGGLYDVSLSIGATNYNRDGLFGGYTRKRTRFLEIYGEVDLFIDDVFEGSSGDILLTTNGRLRTRISGNYYIATTIGNPYNLLGGPQVVGTLDVEGRGDTLCGDNADNQTINGWLQI